MHYILDFDRTIFDTDAFIEFLNEYALMERFPDPTILVEAARHRDLHTFVFPDADRFLTEYGTKTTVLSSALGRSGVHAGSETFLHEKIRCAGVTARVAEVVVVPNEKGEALRHLQEQHQDVVYVDDMEIHVVAARALGIVAFQRKVTCKEAPYCIERLTDLELLSSDILKSSCAS